jgi:hypothetical protein
VVQHKGTGGRGAARQKPSQSSRITFIGRLVDAAAHAHKVPVLGRLQLLLLGGHPQDGEGRQVEAVGRQQLQAEEPVEVVDQVSREYSTSRATLAIQASSTPRILSATSVWSGRQSPGR